MDFTNLELVLTTAISCIGLYFAYRALLLKTGRMKIRGGYTFSSSIACEDEYVGRVTLENVRDRAVTIFAIYLRFGRNLYLEIDDLGDDPYLLGPFETFQKDYGPLEFYSTGTKRVQLNKLFRDKKVRKRLVLSTSDGRYTVRRLLPVWDPVIDFFQNYMTGIFRPIRSVYKGQAFGSNAIYLVELGIPDAETQVILIYPRDHEMKKFKRFRLTFEALESREALQAFLEKRRDEGHLAVESVNVLDLRSSREERFSTDTKNPIEIEPAGLLQYHILGPALTRIDKWQMRRRNKKRAKQGQQTHAEATSEPAPSADSKASDA